MTGRARLLAGLLAIPVALGGVVACGAGSRGDWDQMCVDPNTQMRMPDYYCQQGNPFYHPSWIYYVPYGYVAPGYNHRVTNYTVNNYHAPAHVHIHTDPIPSTGGKVTKPPSMTKSGGTKPGGTSGGRSSVKPKSRSGGGGTYKAPSNRSGRR